MIIFENFWFWWPTKTMTKLHSIAWSKINIFLFLFKYKFIIRQIQFVLAIILAFHCCLTSSWIFNRINQSVFDWLHWNAPQKPSMNNVENLFFSAFCLILTKLFGILFYAVCLSSVMIMWVNSKKIKSHRKIRCGSWSVQKAMWLEFPDFC